jgi:hypothetical protein
VLSTQPFRMGALCQHGSYASMSVRYHPCRASVSRVIVTLVAPSDGTRTTDPSATGCVLREARPGSTPPTGLCDSSVYVQRAALPKAH